MTRPVRLHINRLVLHGVAHKDRAALTRALASALEARLAGVNPGHNRSVGQIRTTAGSATPASLGQSAADTIARTVKGGKS